MSCPEKAGAPVTVAYEDGARVTGQVWSLADVEGYVWLALSNGNLRRRQHGQRTGVRTASGRVYAQPGKGASVAKVAA